MSEFNINEHLEKIENQYLKDLFAYFIKIEPEYKNGILELGITEKTLENLYKNRLKELSKKEKEGDEQSKIDRKIVEKFEKYKEGKVLLQAFKVPVNFLKGKTTKINSYVYINLLAFLLDFKPRTHKDSRKESKKKTNSEKQTDLEKQTNSEKTTPPVENIKKPDDPLDTAALQEQKTSEDTQTPDTKPAKKEQKFFRIMWLLVALVAGILLTVIILVTNRHATIEINGEKINLSRQYYYLKDDGKIKIFDKDSFQAQVPPVARPVTPVIFDQYFMQQNIDTQQAKYQAIKTAYFKKHPVKIISLKDLKESNEVVVKQPVKTKKRETKKLSEKAKHISIVNEKGEPDTAVKNIIEDWLQQQKEFTLIKGQSKYQFVKSQDQKRMICRLSVTVDLKKAKAIKHLTREVIGTGSTKAAARENALMKLELLLENIKL